MGDTTISVHQAGEGTWRVQAELRVAELTASGAYLLHAQPDREHPEHSGLAIAQAWRAMGEQQLAAQQADAALASARSGLDALGDDYAAPLANDDTDMKIYAAEDLIEQGEAANAAGTLLRALESRIKLYQERHTIAAA